MIYNVILQRIMAKIEKAYDYIEHTADTGIIASGKTLEQVFVNCALGMLNLITDLESIGNTVTKEVLVNAGDNNFETLLIEWLNELLYIYDVDRTVFSTFDIISLNRGSLSARCSGEKIDHSRHIIKTEIKAATYHMLSITKTNGLYRAQVIFDI